MIMRTTRRALTLFTLVLAAALTTSPAAGGQEKQGPAALPTPAPQGTPGATPTASPSASPAKTTETAAQRAERLKARREAAAKAAAEQAARLKAEQEEAAAKAKAARAARIEARRVAAAEAAAKLKAEQEEAAKVAAEKAAKLKAEREEAARVAAEAAEKAKAERAARLEARRVAAAEAAAKLKAEQEEAARVAAEKAAQLKAERAARLEARRVAAAEAAAKLKAEQEEASKVAAEKAAKLKGEREEAARVAAEAAEKAKAERAARLEARRAAAAEAAAKLKAEQEEAARVAAEAAEKAKAERATRLEARRVAAAEAAAKLKAEQEEVARAAAEKAAKLKAEREESAAKLKAEQAARAEARRVADEEAARVAAEKAAKLKADREEAARVAAEAAEKAKAERAARIEAKRQADAEAAAKLKAEQEEAARVAAEKAARLKAEREENAATLKVEQAARLVAKRLADEEAAKLAAEKAARLKAEQEEAARVATEKAAKLKAEREEAARAAAEAAEKAKADRAARLEAKRVADEEAAREARERAEQLKAERAAAAARAVADREARVQALAQARAEAAEKLRAQRAAQIENDRIAREEAARREAQAAREQQLRDQAALLAYAEAAAPEEVGSVTAVLGSGLMLNWPEASRRIAIADETIATFHVVSPREVTINGIKPGRTTIFVWLAGGRRLFYRLLVEHNLEPARSALREMNPALILESGADGESVVLRGEVSNEVAARQAKSLVEQLLPRRSVDSRESLRLVNLIRYAGVVGTPEDRLAVAMAAIDPRIRVRRIQSGAEPDVEKDSYVLEGTVRDVNALVQAVVLADRQLGGNGKTVKAADDDRVTFQRSNAGSSLSGGGSGGGGGGNALQALQGGEPPKSGLSAQLARGLLVTSESGRVVSFLRVESLPQVMVGIRVLEVDRTKARRMGMDLRADRKNVSVANYTIPGGEGLPDLRGKVSELAGTGNLVGSYVDKTIAVIAALDFMTEKQVARSVAEPNILTLSGEQASVLVGGEVPIPTTTSNQVSTSSGFFFQQFGVRLDIRPTVDSNGLVTLEVAPSIVTPSSGLGNGSVPGFRIQRVETTARVQAGESLVLGGLLSSTESITERGLPLLGKLPIFRWQRKSIENTELLFLITPRIIVPPTETVRLPPLDFEKEPTNPIGLTGLNEAGVPFTFEPEPAKIAGDATSCVEMRERPSLDSQLLDCLVPETPVKVLEGKASWRRIEVSKGVIGWVKAEGVTPAKSAR